MVKKGSGPIEIIWRWFSIAGEIKGPSEELRPRSLPGPNKKCTHHPPPEPDFGRFWNPVFLLLSDPDSVLVP
jgi:hypothetical protein